MVMVYRQCMAKKTSIYLSDELEQAVEDSGVSLPGLVRRGLERTKTRRR